MARDMYLVGVSEDELKPDPKPEGPKTPKGKWDNYWYHYKWHTLGAIAVVVGSILYRIVYALVLRSPIDINWLKLVTAIIVGLAIAAPTLRSWVAFQKKKAMAGKGE